MYPLAEQTMVSGAVVPATCQLLGFPVAATLSEQGMVSRGICQVNDQGWLQRIDEQHSLPCENSVVFYKKNGQCIQLPPDWLVSMNCWVFHPFVFGQLGALFERFLHAAPAPHSEFYLPTAVQAMLAADRAQVWVRLSLSYWMGITYAGDKEKLVKFVRQEVAHHRYPTPLWT